MADNSQKETKDAGSGGFFGTAISLADTIIYSAGRHGVRIYGLPPNQLAMATVAAALLGIPLAIIVAMFPFWDHVDDLAPLKQLHSFIAPAINSLTYKYRPEGLPNFHLKRFLIASASLVEVVFLSNFFVLFGRRYRRHALLVWTCYDRTKLLQYFGISGLIFCALWYVLFFDWRLLVFLAPSRQSYRLFVYIVMSMPFAALVFGHLAAIVGLGGLRTALSR